MTRNVLLLLTLGLLAACHPASAAGGTPMPTAAPTSVPLTATALPAPTESYPTRCAPFADDGRDPAVPVTVTYIANAGFLVAAGETKVFVDALAGTSFLRVMLSADEVQTLLEARPPFDGVDLVLVTHAHEDHFRADNALAYLQREPGAALVANREAVEAVLAADETVAGRLVTLQPRPHECIALSVNGIELRVLALSHGNFLEEVVNLAIVFRVNGTVFFHTGDMDAGSVWAETLSSYGLPELGIDAAFIPEYLLTDGHYYDRVTLGMQPRFVLPMHVEGTEPAAQILQTYPNAILLQDGLAQWETP